MTNNIKSFSVYQVKFERLTSVMEGIAVIFSFSDFLKISGWRVAGNWSGIYLLILFVFCAKTSGLFTWLVNPITEKLSIT